MKHHDYLTGFKATDKDMKCQGFQFELGKWYKHEGDVKSCKSGFHFCIHPSGPWAYYNDTGTRVFKIEAKDAYEEYTPGTDLKIVCREIRLTEELHPTGYMNTGYMNTGDRNTGYMNTGDTNTGDRNTGYGNTGHRNTGYGNTGDGNTGDRNTGDGNTGYGNTGDGNTGYRNTGDGNTGYGNATNYSRGFFCVKEPCIISFDKQTKLTRAEYVKKYSNYVELLGKLASDQPFDYTAFKNLPGWTLVKCKALHQKHIDGRKR
jgi:hypothetical protein